MGFKIVPAKRELTKFKAYISGASGSGKTHSMLAMATGLAEKLNTKIAVIDTELSRSCEMADEFTFDILPFTAPYSPERYIEAINTVVKGGYGILIIDSMSHEWEGVGGCLEQHDQLGGRFTDWAKITPRHNRFIIFLQLFIDIFCL